jgi:ABC-type phosphate transport system permease subunit
MHLNYSLLPLAAVPCSICGLFGFYQLASQLKQILDISTLPDEELAKYLLRLQTKVGVELDRTFVEPPANHLSS